VLTLRIGPEDDGHIGVVELRLMVSTPTIGSSWTSTETAKARGATLWSPVTVQHDVPDRRLDAIQALLDPGARDVGADFRDALDATGEAGAGSDVDHPGNTPLAQLPRDFRRVVDVPALVGAVPHRDRSDAAGGRSPSDRAACGPGAPGCAVSRPLPETCGARRRGAGSGV